MVDRLFYSNQHVSLLLSPTLLSTHPPHPPTYIGAYAKTDKGMLKELALKYKDPASVDKLCAVAEKVGRWVGGWVDG